MTSKILAGPWATLLLAGAGFAHEPSFEEAPREFHNRLRQRLAAGESVRDEVASVMARSGDRSLEGLLVATPGKSAALRLQDQALRAWKRGDSDGATALYLLAARKLVGEGAASEAAFCLYYVAEIEAERERFISSLRWIERAWQVAGGKSRPYLEGLLLQSQGYSHWFLDQLEASARFFSRALERWRRIGFRAGLLTSWNNLATLYEQMHLWERARHCYENALRLATPPLDDEILFYLHSNLSQFLHRRGDEEGARRHLAQARRLEHVSPHELLLLEGSILGVSERLEDLLALDSPVPSIRIEKALLLSGHHLRHGDPQRAWVMIQEALEESRTHDLHYFTRKCLLALGEWLEREGRYEAAAHSYQESLRHERNLRIPERSFPYSRAVSPLFDGWIRSLVHSGQQSQALWAIRRLASLRQLKARDLDAIPGPVTYRADELEQFELAGRLETQDPLHAPWPESMEESPEAAPCGEFTLLELWPDGTRIYAWVSSGSGWRFLELELPEEVDEAISRLVAPLYEAESSLPLIRGERLQNLYTTLFQPLEAFIDSEAILFVGHKILQNLPLEILQDHQGRYLMERYHFSYLPSGPQPASAPVRKPGAPLLILPAASPHLSEAHREELFLRARFPSLRVVRSLESSLPGSAGWVHVSTHFRLDPRFWLVSGLNDGKQELNILQFLQTQRSWPLLTLGMCDAANSYSSTSPYWLGLSELFLSRGVEALVVSRWRMDELSSRIYRDFYDGVRAGMPLDRALSRAKRDFITRELRRRSFSAPGAHPFFWAGISYVGPPGKVLYAPSDLARPLLEWLLGIGLLLAALSWNRRRKNKCFKLPSRPPVSEPSRTS